MAAVLATSLGATASYTNNSTESNSLSAADASGGSSPSSPPASLLFGVIPRRLGVVDVQAALTLIAFSTAFAVVGARASKRLPERYVRQAQGLLMVAIALSILLSDYLKTSFLPPAPPPPPSPSSHPASPNTSEVITSDCNNRDTKLNEASGMMQMSCSVQDMLASPVSQRLAAVGAFSGLCAGFFGIGGGAVTVPALVYLLDFDYRTALATSLVGNAASKTHMIAQLLTCML